MENPIKMDDLGGKNHPYFWFNTHIFQRIVWFNSSTHVVVMAQLGTVGQVLSMISLLMTCLAIAEAQRSQVRSLR